MNKSDVTAMQAEILAAIEPIAAKYHQKVRTAGGRFDDAEINLKFRFYNIVSQPSSANACSPINTVLLPEDIRLKAEFPHFVGTTVKLNNLSGNCRLVGYKPSHHKYPFIVMHDSSGKRYKISSDVLRKSITITDEQKKNLSGTEQLIFILGM